MSTSGQKTKSFWAYAKCIKSLGRYAPGVKKYRQRFDGAFGKGTFIRFRRYEGPDGEIRLTVEIEI